MSFERRAARARLLAERHPEARAPLEFYAAVADFQATAGPGDFVSLKALVLDLGPEALRGAAREMDEAGFRDAISAYLSGRDRSSPSSFFARALLQVGDPPAREGERGCPRCGHAPQSGILREEGHGAALSLVCSLCFTEWRWPRGSCPACEEGDANKLAIYQAADMEHLQVRACDTCRRYLVVVRSDLDRDAIPDVDEIAALALDVWARERGFVKIQLNLTGI